VGALIALVATSIFVGLLGCREVDLANWGFRRDVLAGID